ncbi:MAG: pectinesterase [Myxococcales bacterium]|nr:pectinesterase [Myxococcales bacterium]
MCPLRRVCIGFALLFVLSGCDQEPDPCDADLPCLAELENDKWTEINPGGETICSRGTEFGFFVSPGTVDKLIIDFRGGGACWNELTCSTAGSIFADSIDSARKHANMTPEEAEKRELYQGIYDRDNMENPFHDWHHVHIPYCTGDAHWGNNYVEYSEYVKIEHKGAVNTRSVMDWIKLNFKNPEKIFITGCSAGAYGAIMWAPHVMNDYPEVPVYHFSDSGAGVITESFFQDSFPKWKAEGALPTFIEALDPTKMDIMTMDMPYLYTSIANHFPERTFSQYTTILDDNQIFYFNAMGGGTSEAWSTTMQAYNNEIASNTDNFYSFVAPGCRHCILHMDEIYETESDGTKLMSWLKDMLDEKTIDQVTCADCAMECLPDDP